MKPTKQTVYLLEEIQNKYDKHAVFELKGIDKNWHDSKSVKEKEGYFFTPEQLNEYTANVIKKALETAAVKVSLIKECGKVGNEKCYSLFCHNCFDIVNSKSITNTFEETFKKFKI